MSQENDQDAPDKRIKIDDLPVPETELSEEDEKNISGGRIGQPSPGGIAGQPSPGDELHRGQPSPGGLGGQPSPGGISSGPTPGIE